MDRCRRRLPDLDARAVVRRAGALRSFRLVNLAALVAVVFLVLVWAFQVGLAAGAPWGAAAWGGRNAGRLPRGLRVASALAAAVLYPLLILYVLSSAAIVKVPWLPGTGSAAMWVLAVVFAVGTLMNAISPSRVERVWAPVSLVIAVCCAVIALGV